MKSCSTEKSLTNTDTSVTTASLIPARQICVSAATISCQIEQDDRISSKSFVSGFTPSERAVAVDRTTSECRSPFVWQPAILERGSAQSLHYRLTPPSIEILERELSRSVVELALPTGPSEGEEQSNAGPTSGPPRTLSLLETSYGIESLLPIDTQSGADNAKLTPNEEHFRDNVRLFVSGERVFRRKAKVSSLAVRGIRFRPQFKKQKSQWTLLNREVEKRTGVYELDSDMDDESKC